MSKKLNYLTLILFVCTSCFSPINKEILPSITPNTFLESINNNLNEINILQNEPCIGDNVTLVGKNFMENKNQSLNIWIQQKNKPSEQSLQPGGEKFPPLYPDAFKLGNSNIDTQGNFTFSFKLENSFSPTKANNKLIIEKESTYIIYIEYGESGGNFKASLIDICSN